ncbi:indoleamine 2,3-dioxygenase [Rhizoctonia solani]|uniref:Indoleamine 2,3-dioxygenase n=1 Tax=Rhizoctonia solani TaxID=456999 RepID=A0A0K6GC58_9AGAM|nr:indoleamine 2,3-dioxygenase [Rhizoctonia solani]
MNALTKLFGLLGIAAERPSSATRDNYQLPNGSPDMSSLACSEFGLDSRTGFLPTQVPLARLPATFDRWEDALQHAMIILKRPGDSDDPPPTDEEKDQSLRWRENLRRMEVIGIDSLKSDLRAAQRAHHVLAFLVQFYVQSLPPRDEADLGPIRIPGSLAIPFVDISRHLDIAPILTYADCVLWNFYLEDPSKPLTLENIRIRDLFTKDYQEEHFFLTSARIELRGFEAIQLMGDAIVMTHEAQATRTNVDETRLQDTLTRLAVVIDDLNRILWAVRDACGYQFFYWVFRPWIRGTDQGYGSPKWLYEGVDGEGIEFQCSGPSAGQAALMHAFDVFLGIGHPQKDDRYSPTCTGMRVHPSYDPHGSQQTCPASSASSPYVTTCPVTGNSSASPTEMSEELRSFLLDETAYLTPPPEKTEMSLLFPPKLTVSLERPTNLLTPPSSPHGSPVLSATSPDPGMVPKLQPHTDLDTSFIVRMRKYIPGNHQKFLLHLAHSNIRPHVALCSNSGVRRAYNDCVWAIKRFRDTHIKIVTLYVIHPARSKVLVKDAEAESAPVRGTGGTSLVPLLKAYRNNTANTMFQTD